MSRIAEALIDLWRALVGGAPKPVLVPVVVRSPRRLPTR
jgi:hypothetical protein